MPYLAIPECSTDEINMNHIKIIGVGGGAGCALNYILEKGIKGVTCIAVNTDKQSLSHSLTNYKIKIGENLLKGLGAGGDPNLGYEAAQESIAHVQNVIVGAKVIFVVAGMGGGTGTGAAPVIAQLAKSMGALTISVITTPFAFEGRARMAIAKAGVIEMCQHTDSQITIPNSHLVRCANKNATFKEVLKESDKTLYLAIKDILKWPLVAMHN